MGCGKAARAASQVWLGMDGQGIGVRGIPGSISVKTPFFMCQLQKRKSVMVKKNDIIHVPIIEIVWSKTNGCVVVTSYNHIYVAG